MIDPTNPYASPQAEERQPASAVESDDRRLAVDSKHLIVPFGAQFPDRCVKCNEPALGYKLRRDLAWHSPMIYLLLLLNILIYLVVAMAVRRKATVLVGLCPEHRSRRRWWQVVCTVLGVSAVAGLVAAAVLESGLLAIASVVLFVPTIVAAIITTPVVSAGCITDRHAEVRGCGREFLQALPGWDGALL
ncbi:hypothetical protein KOR34_31940 [Posidoniimonas corsicana]|uniref:Uncharacterized protein n=1 Tax=Posidoniimonas corsicana TaxID=1938618 RepID=A0A5C5VK75_9BACT|nr:hypothetical protein [Posidoniimonas corsicana]TWT38225.1 hypothetical protein KOR34_31940 [Posidoniimonas corsicana]